MRRVMESEGLIESTGKERGRNGSRKGKGIMMELIDNISCLLGDNLKQIIQPRARLKISALCFGWPRNSLNIRGLKK